MRLRVLRKYGIMYGVMKQAMEKLVAEYAERFGKESPFPGPVLARRRISQRIQEELSGGLNAIEAATLDRIAEGDPILKREARLVRRKGLPARGVTYVRKYKGKVYEAKAVGRGWFEMGGKTYPSLTACVKAITGMHDSGRRWFNVSGGAR